MASITRMPILKNSRRGLAGLRGVRIRECAARIGRGDGRMFSTSAVRATDGVYRELTAMRTRVPFIEAFRREEEKRMVGEKGVEKEKEKEKVVLGGEGLEVKRMSDSYHRVVSFSCGFFVLFCFPCVRGMRIRGFGGEKED